MVPDNRNPLPDLTLIVFNLPQSAFAETEIGKKQKNKKKTNCKREEEEFCVSLGEVIVRQGRVGEDYDQFFGELMEFERILHMGHFAEWVVFQVLRIPFIRWPTGHSSWNYRHT